MSGKQANRVYPQCFHNLPRNDEDYQGGYVLYCVTLHRFYVMEFGNGDNLTQQDIDRGYDDYMMIGAFQPEAYECMMDIVRQIQDGNSLDSIRGLTELTSLQMMIRRKEYGRTGDARAYIANALEMLGYGWKVEERMYKDLLFITKLK